MTVLTPAAFVAAKMSAWLDRREARDLYDLWALAEAGFIDDVAADVYRQSGPSGSLPSWLGSPPTANVWEARLGHQCRIAVGPDTAFERVKAAWRSVR